MYEVSNYILQVGSFGVLLQICMHEKGNLVLYKVPGRR